MYDLERISILIGDIDSYFDRLNFLEINPKTLNECKFYAGSMLVFSIVNSAIDLAEELVKAERAGFPKTYLEVFELLKKKKIIGGSDLDNFKKLILLRNNIAHNYTKIGEKGLKTALVEIRVVKEFTKKTKLWIRGK